MGYKLKNGDKVDMRYLVMVIALLTVTIVAVCPSCAKASATRRPKEVSPSSAGESLLKMVFIRTSSRASIKQLRAMPIDIIRVRPDPERPADKNSLAGGFIVEAVVPTDILPKLRAMGFDVFEVPPKYK